MLEKSIKTPPAPAKADDAKHSPAPSPNKWSLILIFLTIFIDLVGFGLIIPVLPLYARQLHANDFTVGLLIASYSLMQFVFTPLWGRLSDRIGRRPVLLTSLLASAIGYALWGFSSAIVGLFIARMVAGAGNANIAVGQAYIADVTTQENRARGMAIFGIAFGLGFVMGPAIGGFCAPYGLQSIGFIACALSLIDFVLTFFFLPEPKTHSRTGSERFSIQPSFYFKTLVNDRLKLSLAIFFISTFAFSGMESTIVLLTQDRFGFTARQNSLMFTYVGVLILLVQGGLVHRMAKKYGEKKLVCIGTFLTGIGLLMTGFAYQSPVIYLALAFLAFGSGFNTPSNQSMLSKLAGKESVGGVLGVGQSVSTLGRIIGPALACGLYSAFGTTAPYYLSTLAMVLAFALSFALPNLSDLKDLS